MVQQLWQSIAPVFIKGDIKEPEVEVLSVWAVNAPFCCHGRHVLCHS